MTPQVKEILSWYGSENPGVLTNLARILNHGRIGGTGKMVILPVDQGFEHGPARSFAKNPAAYSPEYHFKLAIEAGCNAYAAPLGFLESCAREYAGDIPLILKLNNSDSLFKTDKPISALTGSIEAAQRLGCVGIGFTIYPGSAERKQMYEEIARLTDEAKRVGLVVVMWAYARGEHLSKAGETSEDTIAYCAHIAAQLGAHIIKVKPPTSHLESPEAKKEFEAAKIPIETMADRIREVVRSAFNGKRIIIFSGGEAKSTEALLQELRDIAKGGGFGSIMGRNAFQRPHAESIQLLHNAMDIFAGRI